ERAQHDRQQPQARRPPAVLRGVGTHVLASVRPHLMRSSLVNIGDVFDPFDASRSRDAWETLQRLRDESAVVSIAQGMRYVTRHEEARSVLRDTEHFSNASGMKAPGVVIPVEDRLLGELDPPRHTLVRRVMVTAMTPKVVHASEPFIASTSARLLDALPHDRFDLVASYTGVLPNRVTMHLLGFDPADS